GNKKTIILDYHRVLDIKADFPFDENSVSASVGNFRKQSEYLSKKYNVISLEEFVEHCKKNKNPPKNSAVITFDDGYIDNYLFAYPILKKYNIPATIFLTANYISTNKIFWWDKIAYAIKKTEVKNIDIKNFGKYKLEKKQQKADSLRDIMFKLKKIDETEKNSFINLIIQKTKLKIPKDIKRNTLSWDEITEMSKNNISFGSHTLNHPILTKIPISEAENEIKESKRIIEEKIKNKIKFFCYPNGEFSDFNNKIKKILRENGFECSVLYIPGFNSKNSDVFELKRVFVRYNDDIILFKNKLAGVDIVLFSLYRSLKRIARRNKT
ncbi:MAG: polysaccharide deacetylase family protein, partial [Candidatus Nanoarchaeia archaeon]|nr:polysaccharide deacetylase family protein [Candidatus Nanoarchaeia archaeon]